MIEEVAGLPLDKRLAVMQTATRWIAVKNRLAEPEERNGFDDFREQFSGAPGPREPASEAPDSAERGDQAGSETALIRRGRGKLNSTGRTKQHRGPPPRLDPLGGDPDGAGTSLAPTPTAAIPGFPLDGLRSGSIA